MTRIAITLALLAALAAPAAADVTIKQTTTGKGLGMSGTMPGKPMKNGQPGPNLYCAVIVKRVDAKTRSKTSINELLRD